MSNNKGFTLFEIIIVITVIGILAAIVIPNYQAYVRKGKRVAMMTEMQNIANKIEARKLTEGNYNFITSTYTNVDFPTTNSNYSYTVAPATSNWVITATPKTTSEMKDDGILTLNFKGQKCRASHCGSGNEWNEN